MREIFTKDENTMDDEAETYKLWRIRKTVMQVCVNVFCMAANLKWPVNLESTFILPNIIDSFLTHQYIFFFTYS